MLVSRINYTLLTVVIKGIILIKGNPIFCIRIIFDNGLATMLRVPFDIWLLGTLYVSREEMIGQSGYLTRECASVQYVILQKRNDILL